MCRIRFSNTPDNAIFEITDMSSLVSARNAAFSINGNKNKKLSIFIACPPCLSESWDDVYGPEITASDDLLLYRYFGLIFAQHEKLVALADLVMESRALSVSNAISVDLHETYQLADVAAPNNVISVDFTKGRSVSVF